MFEGAQIGQYLIDKFLDQGSSAKVYLVHDEERKQFALKVVDRLKLNPQGLRNLRREIKISKTLSNPNIMKLSNDFCHENFVCMVFELCEGSSIEKYLLKSNAPRPYQSKWTYQLLNGIRYIHCKGIIHRDIKLDNIFLTKSLEAKLGDFGLSKLIDMAKTRCGTPYYMAPEVLRQSDYSCTADIWSAGVTIFKMLYGYYPYMAGDIQGLRELQKEEVYFPEEAEEDEKELINNMLEYEQSKRKNVDQLLECSFFRREELEEEMIEERWRKSRLGRLVKVWENATVRCFLGKARARLGANYKEAPRGEILHEADNATEERLSNGADFSFPFRRRPDYLTDCKKDIVMDGAEESSHLATSHSLLSINTDKSLDCSLNRCDCIERYHAENSDKPSDTKEFGVDGTHHIGEAFIKNFLGPSEGKPQIAFQGLTYKYLRENIENYIGESLYGGQFKKKTLLATYNAMFEVGLEAALKVNIISKEELKNNGINSFAAYFQTFAMIGDDGDGSDNDNGSSESENLI